MVVGCFWGLFLWGGFLWFCFCLLWFGWLICFVVFSGFKGLQPLSCTLSVHFKAQMLFWCVDEVWMEQLSATIHAVPFATFKHWAGATNWWKKPFSPSESAEFLPHFWKDNVGVFFVLGIVWLAPLSTYSFLVLKCNREREIQAWWVLFFSKAHCQGFKACAGSPFFTVQKQPLFSSLLNLCWERSMNLWE